MDFEDMMPEEFILEDLQEWCEVNLLDGKTWDEYLDQFDNRTRGEKMSELMDIYWRDHIFPIDNYV